MRAISKAYIGAAADPDLPCKEASRKSRKPFRFLDLPFDARRIVYELCLVSLSDIDIYFDRQNAPEVFDTATVTNDGIIDVEVFGSIPRMLRRRGESSNRNINRHLLRTNKAVHREAAAVLYSQNTFCFEGLVGFVALTYFQRHLTNASRASLRSLEVEIPLFLRPDYDFEGSTFEVHDFSKELLQITDAMTNLKSLTLILLQDIYAGDFDDLYRLGRKSGARICLEVGSFSCLHPDRLVQMRLEVYARLISWGWTLAGKVDLNDGSQVFGTFRLDSKSDRTEGLR